MGPLDIEQRTLVTQLENNPAPWNTSNLGIRGHRLLFNFNAVMSVGVYHQRLFRTEFQDFPTCSDVRKQNNVEQI